MNEDYLWDKSGEPDPQIQELEQILAPLRYQPKPLALPVTRRRNYFPLAIAATLLIALLAGGLWLRSRSQKPAQRQVAESGPTVPAAPSPSVPSVFKENPSASLLVKNAAAPKRNPVPRHKPVLTTVEREEALAAKQQVMLALRLASEKLRLAQQRTQGASPNQIKNQHKVG
jgi:hypothetical protein